MKVKALKEFRRGRGFIKEDEVMDINPTEAKALINAGFVKELDVPENRRKK